MDVSTASGVERVGAHGLDDAVVFRVDDHHISGQLSDDIRLAFVSVKDYVSRAKIRRKLNAFP